MRRKTICQIDKTHPDRIKSVLQKLPKDIDLMDMSMIFSALSDQTRLKILCALLSESLCGCDLVEIASSSKSAVSHQMRVLKMTKLVKSRRVGKQVFYSIADEHVRKILMMALEHVKEGKQ